MISITNYCKSSESVPPGTDIQLNPIEGGGLVYFLVCIASLLFVLFIVFPLGVRLKAVASEPSCFLSVLTPLWAIEYKWLPYFILLNSSSNLLAFFASSLFSLAILSACCCFISSAWMNYALASSSSRLYHSTPFVNSCTFSSATFTYRLYCSTYRTDCCYLRCNLSIVF